MKQVLLCAILMMTFTVFSGMSQSVNDFGNGQNKNLSLQVIYQPVDDIEPENPDHGDRIPSRRLVAEIGDGWVRIEGVDESEIVSFEISDYDGFPIGTFQSVTEFTDTLFSLQGEYVVRFYTEEYVYTGYVWIP